MAGQYKRGTGMALQIGFANCAGCKWHPYPLILEVSSVFK